MGASVPGAVMDWEDAELAALHSEPQHLAQMLVMIRESCKLWGAPGYVPPEPAVEVAP